MATRYVSDNARANWSSTIAAIVGVGGALGWEAAVGDLGSGRLLTIVVRAYLIAWPLFTVIYLWWTHRVYAGRGARSLAETARREKQLQKRWWTALFGYGSASSWTLLAALAAVFIAVVVAQQPEFRADFTSITLGLVCVAASWALMVYAFALQYLRLDAGADTDHITIDSDDEAGMSEYLTLAILLSTMAATVSAKIRTRQAWLLVRTNVLFAFIFNSVIVAMVVSLLLGGILG